MKLEPRNYQIFASYWLARRSGGILGDEVGLGKSLSFSLTCQTLKAQRVLLICPKRLKLQWATELEKYEPGQVHIHDLGIHFEVEVYNPNLIRTYTLAHYEQFQFEANGKYPKLITQGYLAQSWDVVGLDECHYIKNRNAQRTRLIKKLKTKVKIGLTGTPVAEYPQDLWSLLNWLAPKDFTSFWHFVEIYCDTEKNWASGQLNIVGIRQVIDPATKRYTKDITLRLLKERVREWVLVRRLEDVGVELPPRTITDITLEMEPAQQAFYQRVKKEVVIELKNELGDPNVWDLSSANKLVIRSGGARYTRLQQTASAPTTFEVYQAEDNVKLDWLRDYVEGGGKPAVIMTRFTHTVEKIKALLVKLRAPGFTVGTYESIGTGLNLQHYNWLIAWDAPKSRLDWEQAMGRIRRLGQDKPQFIQRLVIHKSIDEHGWKLIDKKFDETDIILAWLREVYQESIGGV